MVAVARITDQVFSQTGSGYKCGQPLPTTTIAEGSERCFAEKLGIARNKDKVADHSIGGCELESTDENNLMISASSRVFVEGRMAARIGDSAPSDNTITQGSTRVFFG